MNPGFDLSGMSGSPSFQGGGATSTSGDVKAAFDSAFNSSGWNVAMGSGTATGAAGINLWVLVGGAALILIWLIKR